MPTDNYGPFSVPSETMTLISTQTIGARNGTKSMRHLATPIADRLIKTKGVYTGAHTIRVPFNLGPRHTVATALTLATQFKDVNSVANVQLSSGYDQPFWLAQPIFIGGIDLAMEAASEAGLQKLTKIRTDDVMQHLEDSLQKAVMRGTIASGSWSPDASVQAFNGINALNGIDFSTGFFEEASSGNNTVHNVARSSYPATTHARFHNVVADFGDAVSTAFYDQMVLAQLTAQIRGFDYGGADAFGTTAFLQNVSKVQRQGLQYATIGEGQQQYGISAVLGKPVTPCIDMPTNGANTGTNQFSMMMTPFGESGVQLLLHPKWSFTMRPWTPIPGKIDCQVAFICVAGQLVTTAPGSALIGVNGETY